MSKNIEELSSRIVHRVFVLLNIHLAPCIRDVSGIMDSVSCTNRLDLSHIRDRVSSIRDGVSGMR